jgi:hypothetical protein
MGKRYILKLQQQEEVQAASNNKNASGRRGEEAKEGLQPSPMYEDKDLVLPSSTPCVLAKRRINSAVGKKDQHHINHIAQLFCCADAVFGSVHASCCSPGACLLLPGVVVHTNNPPDKHKYVDKNDLDLSFPLPPTQRLEALLEREGTR